MNTVTFGEYNSFSDLNLILSSKTIGSPSVKTSTVDLPGADGELDFTEYFGEPKYSNRTLKFQFTAVNPSAIFDSKIKNILHGQKKKIVLSDNPDVYFYGRIAVGDWHVNKGIATIDIECNCDPYRFKIKNTIKTLVYGVSSSSNICPHFKLWQTGTAVSAQSEDTITFSSSAKVTSPKIPIAGATWITLHFATYARYYVAQYDSAGTSIQSTPVNSQSYKFKTAENTAYLQITLYPASNAPFPVTYSNLMLYVGEDIKSYERYDPATELNCENSRMSVIPTIKATAPITLSYNGATVSIAANTEYRIPEFELHFGKNVIEVTKASTGTVITATYREGDL